MASRIHDYAVIGDCRSAALVSRAGSIDWLCWPRFDSPSIFGALLDERAGHWSIAPDAVRRIERRYVEGTNVLETRFETETGTLLLVDWGDPRRFLPHVTVGPPSARHIACAPPTYIHWP